MPNKYATGKKAIAECDRCGFQYQLKKLKELTIKTKNVNILVCPTCWEPDQPQLQLGMYPVDDPQALRNPRPDTSYQESGNQSIGSRIIQWGWNPVGLDNQLNLPIPNVLEMQVELGIVTVAVS